MSGVEPPGAQDSLKPVAPRSMQRPSSQMGAGGLPSAADIWSTQAEAPAPLSKPAEQIATEKLLHGPVPAEAPKLGSIWQNSAWQKAPIGREPDLAAAPAVFGFAGWWLIRRVYLGW